LRDGVELMARQKRKPAKEEQVEALRGLSVGHALHLSASFGQEVE